MLANHHLSALTAAHLHNGLRQMNLTHTRGLEMEKVIEIHLGPIFAGDIPTELKAMPLCSWRQRLKEFRQETAVEIE
jgi:hypothetical protein